MRFPHAVVLALACLLPAVAPCQDRPEIDIRLVDGQTARALDPLEFTVAVTLPAAAVEPGAPAADDARPRLSLVSVEVKPGGLLAPEYEDAARCIFQTRGLYTGQRVEAPCFLYPRENAIRKKLLPGLGPVFARSLLLEAKVKTIQDDNPYDWNTVARVRVLPPLVAVFYGGIAGALMLAVFRGLAPFRHGVPRRPLVMPGSWREFWHGLVPRAFAVARVLALSFAWGVLGGISAIMIIILTKASTGELSPIQVEINDFVGGVLVGLLSFPVVNWLEKRLLASEENPS